MESIEKLILIIEKLKDFDTWKEFKNDPEWLNKELRKEDTDEGE